MLYRLAQLNYFVITYQRRRHKKVNPTMEIEKIRSKILELANGNPDFPAQFGEMCIRDLESFPKTATDAFHNRDIRKLTHAIHQMKTIIGLFELTKLNSYLNQPPELFEASNTDKKEFLLNVRNETRRIADLFRECVGQTK